MPKRCTAIQCRKVDESDEYWKQLGIIGNSRGICRVQFECKIPLTLRPVANRFPFGTYNPAGVCVSDLAFLPMRFSSHSFRGAAGFFSSFFYFFCFAQFSVFVLPQKLIELFIQRKNVQSQRLLHRHFAAFFLSLSRPRVFFRVYSAWFV